MRPNNWKMVFENLSCQRSMNSKSIGKNVCVNGMSINVNIKTQAELGRNSKTSKVTQKMTGKPFGQK